MSVTQDFRLSTPAEVGGSDESLDAPSVDIVQRSLGREGAGEFVFVESKTNLASVIVGFGSVGETAAVAQLGGGLLLERAPEGLIVSDPYGAAYGIGETIDEAWAEWRAEAMQHLADLRGNVGRLHPRMERQLRYLTMLFG